MALARVKNLTGLSQIKARRMRENPFQFRPSHKLFLDCNYRPVVSDPNDAIWNRLKCIPFNEEIPADEIDTDLPNKMRNELPGILAWIVQGTGLYLKEGLGKPPQEIVTATNEYRHESDLLSDFFEEVCHFDIGNTSIWFSQTALFKEYLGWAEHNVEKRPLNKKQFESQLESKGCKKKQKDDGKVRAWEGVITKYEFDRKRDKVTESDK